MSRNENRLVSRHEFSTLAGINSGRPVAGNRSGRRRADQAEAISELYGPIAQRVRGGGPQTDYLQLLVCSVFVRTRAPKQWAKVTDLVAEAVADQSDPAELLDSIGEIADTVLREHDVPEGMRRAFARLQPTAVEDVAQVLRTCHDLSHDSLPALLDRFAAWGQHDGTELHTPSGIVQLMTDSLLGEVTGPVQCHDPYLRSGEFLSRAAAVVPGVVTSGFGRHPDQLRLAAMTIAAHGAGATGLVPGDALAADSRLHPPKRFDFVVTNPPFNQKASREWPVPAGGWPFGTPPKKNGNFAWLQHVFTSLSDGGRAAVIMPNQAGVSEDKAELTIRAAMVDQGAVECIVALPPGLFATTAVPVSIWFLVRQKKIRHSVLFIDARATGGKNGGQRRLSEDNVRSIVEILHEWRLGATEFRSKNLGRGGIAVAASLAEIRDRGYSLSPADHRPIPGTVATEDAVPLDTLCEIQAGPSNAILKKLQTVDNGVPIIAPAQLRHRGITDEHTKRVSREDAARLEKYQLRDRDILCARTGTLGPCAIADHKTAGALFATGLIRLRVRDLAKVDPHYLVAFLSLPSTVTWIENKAAGTTIPSISSANLGKLPVPLPSLDEQQRIGAKLADADADIVALHKRIQIAEDERTKTAIALFANPRLA
ncbi:N-6 DNA methylase [Nocardia farcinica]|uniref:N-6 DNA methylase n=1 Tax=Nocardia farcinica TaxID=37329 RepID=UPI00245508EE|nr:N-6 DNA methylase [Nocardia farcinica]